MLPPHRCSCVSERGSSALHAGERLVVRQRVQAVAVEVVEARAVVRVSSALGRHDDAGQATVLGAVRVRQHLDLRDRVEARRGVADRAEDRIRRGLAVLDVATRRRCGAQELHVVECRPRRSGSAAGSDWMSRLLRGRSCSCCSSSPRAIAWLSSVMLFSASAVTVTVSVSAPSSSVTSTSAVPAARRTTPVFSNFLKLGATDLDAVGPRLEVRGLVATLGIGVDARGTPVSSSMMRTLARATTAPWGSVTVPRMRTEERLREGRGGTREEDEQYPHQRTPRHTAPCSAYDGKSLCPHRLRLLSVQRNSTAELHWLQAGRGRT